MKHIDHGAQAVKDAEAVTFLCVCVSHSIMSDSSRPHGLQLSRLLCPWDSPGKNNGVGYHFLSQWTFPTQRLNPDLPHCRQILYHQSHQGSPIIFLQEKKKRNILIVFLSARKMKPLLGPFCLFCRLPNEHASLCPQGVVVI